LKRADVGDSAREFRCVEIEGMGGIISVTHGEIDGSGEKRAIKQRRNGWGTIHERSEGIMQRIVGSVLERHEDAGPRLLNLLGMEEAGEE
jgi:hypothetical protein